MIKSTEIQFKNPAIVIGLDCMTGLQTARILTQRKVPVIALAKDLNHFACRTRTCERIMEANIDSQELIETLEQLGPWLEYKAVLFPCTDSSVSIISQYRQRLRHWYHVVLPEDRIVNMLMDKIEFYKYAQELGLPVPATRLVYCKSDAEAAAAELSFPCILKPPVRTPEWEANMEEKVYKVFSARELLTLYAEGSQWSEVLLVQEWIPGDDSDLYSCNCYFNSDSEPVVSFIARKIRQWPPQAGTSCLGEECRNDDVLQTSLNLFKRAGYRGLGYVEMKRDSRTGRHYIIEPNIGRPTGRSAIAEAGGVELLFTAYCDVLGKPLPEKLEQQYGSVKWIYLRRDLQSAFHYWRKGELSIMEWLNSIRGRKFFAVFSLRDPKPFVFDFIGKALGLFSRTKGTMPPAKGRKSTPEMSKNKPSPQQVERYG